MKDIYHLMKYIYFIIKMNPNKLSDKKLEAVLRTWVHSVEKNNNIDNNSNVFSMLFSRKYYYVAKRRKILSEKELEWCEIVLFGIQPKKEQRKKESLDVNNNNLIDVIKHRRSIRKWDEGSLEKQDFELLVESAKWAPSSCHRQPWQFILTNNKESINTLAELRGQQFVKKAPSCIIVLISKSAFVTKEASYTPYLDAGAAIQNLLLVADSLGYGACWVNFGSAEIIDEQRKIIEQLFSIPDEFEIVSIIPIGKNPAVSPHPPGRKKTSDIMHIENF